MASPTFRGFGRKSLGYRMLIPASVMILAISIFPLINGFRLSLMSYNLLRPDTWGYIGVDNFIELSSDSEFFGVLAYSFIYTFFVVLVSYAAGLGIALLLNRNIRFRGLFRALVLIPWVIPPVVAATNWLWVLNDQIGIINEVLQSAGIIDKPILFLGRALNAQITVIFTTAWKALPFMMIVLLAGLQSIPNEFYEAAKINGAGFLLAFRYVTMPMVKNVSLIATTLMFIWTYNNFENVYLLTQGGPSQATFVLPILSYFTAFFRSRLGYASAIAVAMLFVLLALSVFYLRFQREADY